MVRHGCHGIPLLLKDGLDSLVRSQYLGQGDCIQVRSGQGQIKSSATSTGAAPAAGWAFVYLLLYTSGEHLDQLAIHPVEGQKYDNSQTKSLQATPN